MFTKNTKHTLIEGLRAVKKKKTAASLKLPIWLVSFRVGKPARIVRLG